VADRPFADRGSIILSPRVDHLAVGPGSWPGVSGG